jgi:hypothetical protein
MAIGPGFGIATPNVVAVSGFTDRSNVETVPELPVSLLATYADQSGSAAPAADAPTDIARHAAKTAVVTTAQARAIRSLDLTKRDLNRPVPNFHAFWTFWPASLSSGDLTHPSSTEALNELAA